MSPLFAFHTLEPGISLGRLFANGSTQTRLRRSSSSDEEASGVTYFLYTYLIFISLFFFPSILSVINYFHLVFIFSSRGLLRLCVSDNSISYQMSSSILVGGGGIAGQG